MKGLHGFCRPQKRVMIKGKAKVMLPRLFLLRIQLHRLEKLTKKNPGIAPHVGTPTQVVSSCAQEMSVKNVAWAGKRVIKSLTLTKCVT